MKKELTILIAGVSVWTAGIIIAPAVSGSIISEALYRAYSVVCHQFESRSFHLNDEPFGVCIRCTSIYAAFLVTLIVIRFWNAVRTEEFHSIRLLAIAGIPMALDGMFTLFNVFEATTISRILTGALFGAGMALLLHRVLTETLRSIITGRIPTYDPKTR